ncbi:MAG: GFA family protein [Sphingomonadales bacterium]|nr:GFA family protein [Sphingomonadales bacterium]
MVTGQCNCGAVAFEVRAELSDVFICHCSICRRYTGSSGIAVVIADNQQFRWLRGEDQIAIWEKPDADWQAHFCRLCGSALPGPNDEARMFIPAGLISDGGENLRVAHHIWVGSKAVWDEIGDSGKQHDEAFEG